MPRTKRKSWQTRRRENSERISQKRRKTVGDSYEGDIHHGKHRLADLIEGDSSEITDDIVQWAIEIMRMHSPSAQQPYIGCYTPAELRLFQTTADDHALMKPPVPHQQVSINIHHIQGHWLTSYFNPASQQLLLFDSLRTHNHLIEVKPQLELIYGKERADKVLYPMVTQQTCNPICGIMAIAYAFSCFCNLDCRNLQYETTAARNHLRQCLLNDSMEPFPAFPLDSQCSSSNLLQKYFQDQEMYKKKAQERKIIHRQRKSQEEQIIERQEAKERMSNLRKKKGQDQQVTARQKNKARMSDLRRKQETQEQLAERENNK